MKISEANKLRLLYFWAFCCQAAWAPILADYLKQKGLNGFNSAVILVIIPVMFFVVQPIAGMMKDTYYFSET